MTESYLWRHEPLISAPPIEVINHFLHEDGETVFEVAVFRLENENYLFISFCTECKTEKEVGITDMEEFDNLEEAVRLYVEAVGEQNENRKNY